MDSVTILPADKGNCSVVQAKVQYKESATKIIEAGLKDGTYINLSKDPTKQVVSDLKKLLKEYDNKLGSVVIKKLTPPISHISLFYSLPKIHKVDPEKLLTGTIPPVRPINSMCGSPLDPLSKFLSKIISPCLRFVIHRIKNSRSLARLLRKK